MHPTHLTARVLARMRVRACTHDVCHMTLVKSPPEMRSPEKRPDYTAPSQGEKKPLQAADFDNGKVCEKEQTI